MKLIKHPPGHYYSPIPNINDVKKQKELLYDLNKPKIEGIELNSKLQKELLEVFKEKYEHLPFPATQGNNFRFYYENHFFSYTDAIILFSMLLEFQPSHVIEVGSGFSSALMLDTKDKFLNNCRLTFIEPYPQRLNSLLRGTDMSAINLIAEKVQFIKPNHFDSLGENDILFIDSSHVAKSGSDVTYLYFEILPKLKKGVIIHIHDIFYPFEYPLNWLEAGRSWNEAHFLRAFLMGNSNFEIIMFNNYIVNKEHNWFQKNMPLCLKNSGGSIWLRKVS